MSPRPKKARWAQDHLRLAILDLGTNSIRFDAYAIDKKGRAELLHKEKRPVRLGEGLYRSGKLSTAALGRVQHALADFHTMSEHWGIDQVSAYATSALRDAKDGAQLLRHAEEKWGIKIQVISGLKEAELIALGVLENEKPPRGTYVLADIGGGSTELSLCEGRKVRRSVSLKLGALRLEQVFLQHQPPSYHEALALRDEVRGQAARQLKSWKAKTLVGSSGTIKTLGRMASHQHHSYDLAFLRHINEVMLRADKAALLNLPGMEAKRVDIILSGSLLLEALVEWLGVKKIKVSRHALRDGLLIQELKKLGF